ncbi:MAG: lysophospholipid acyltransferase family protein [Saccharofermentanales bacterium]|jgi:1-acyl-sn-glycerol-3-phosphate acyltransferase|nr:1-acyl-sn-glycerol-3-phosphate acyltransferase [Clostridiaceae bacterium]
MKKHPKNNASYNPPSGWFYTILRGLAWFFCTVLFGVKIHRDPRLRNLRGPLIILGNHPSYLDPLIMAIAFRGRRLHFLAADCFFRKPLLNRILTRLAAIPKIQFHTDMQATRRMIQVLRHGGGLAIYPEGQRSLDGGSRAIDDAIAKMISKMQCPVAVVNIEGAYLTWPRWSKRGFRPGRIDARAFLLYEAADLDKLSVDQIKQGIEEALHFNDYRWQEKRRVVFRSRAPAKGLHNLCHQCPSCRGLLAMRSERTGLTCSRCGYLVAMDAWGFLHEESPDPEKRIFSLSDPWRWHQWQLREIREMLADDHFHLEFPATVDLIEQGGHVSPAGRGVLRLTTDQMVFVGQEPVEPAHAPLNIQLPYQTRIGLSFIFGVQFEMAVREQTYRFRPEPGQAVILIIDAILASGNHPELDKDGRQNG